MLEVGKPFPNFSLPNQDGKTVSLSDFAGKWLVVYFYPKDDTPGCTVQGKFIHREQGGIRRGRNQRGGGESGRRCIP
jgi:peroxiredoxin